MKIKQGDKLLPLPTKAKWIGHSTQSDGHVIYQPGSQKVTVERNFVFDMGEKPKLSPVIPSDDPKVSMSK